MTDPSVARPAAVLVGVQLPDVTDAEHASDLAELGRLVDTLGYEVVAVVSQRRRALAHGAVLGEGKLVELARITGGTGNFQAAIPVRKAKKHVNDRAEPELGPDDDELEADDDLGDDTRSAAGDAGDGGDAQPGEAAGSSWNRSAGREIKLVAVDHDITPSQLRNIERAMGVDALDRTGVIIEIFHRRARSREARLQVELARLTYVAPRLREAGGSGERQHGRGSGQSALELDRRRIRDRMAELRDELASVERNQNTRRSARSQARRVALVGYTNAGKSSLMRRLTGSDVLVEDRLFATLDTTVRALHPETRPRVLVSDTVGFIKKLPHDLVASFRSTLDEALEASLVLHVVDSSDAGALGQLEVTREVLADIGADAVPTLVVWNKTDRADAATLDRLRADFPDAIFMSARDAADVARLREDLIAFFERGMQEAELFVPYTRQALVSQIHESTRVLDERYDEGGTHLRVRAEPSILDRLRTAVAPVAGDDAQ
jgi:GTPase